MPIARYLPEKNPREAAFSAKGAEAIEIAFRNPKFRSSTESSYISPIYVTTGFLQITLKSQTFQNERCSMNVF
jgi:hypothetical protein